MNAPVDRRVIREAPSYFATADGRIWSTLNGGRFLRPATRRDGYFYVALRANGVTLQRAVHRLVAAAFFGDPPEGAQSNHLNLCKTDNRSSNLEWTTPAGNTAHAWANLPAPVISRMRERRSYGARKMNRKKRLLTPAQITQVRDLLSHGVPHMHIAPRFSVSRSTIDNIAKGRIYVD